MIDDDDELRPVKRYGPPQETSYAKVLGGCGIGFGLFIVTFFLVIWLNKENQKDIPSISPARSPAIVDSRVKVVYRVLGPQGTKIHLMYKDASGRTTELLEEVPWTTNFMIRPGYELYVSAQSDGPVSELTCSIVADDQPIQATIASGENAPVACTGIAP